MSAKRLTSPKQTMNRTAARWSSRDGSLLLINPAHVLRDRRGSEDRERDDARIAQVLRLDAIADPLPQPRPEESGDEALRHHRGNGAEPDDGERLRIVRGHGGGGDHADVGPFPEP